jgi:hypothetical protein
MAIIISDKRDKEVRTIRLKGEEIEILMGFIRSRFTIEDYEFLRPILNKIKNERRKDRGNKD